MTLTEANAFVRARHRHHSPVVGYRFAIGAAVDDKLVGVVIVGRPVAAKTNAGRVAEVTRLCTDGTKNACSFLYAAAARAAKAMGYERVQTFILASESGISLRASGWIYDGTTPGKAWEHSQARQLFLSGSTRINDHPLGEKQRWIKELACPR
jgi:hypothetical protein